MTSLRSLFALALALTGCGTAATPDDAGTDSGTDAGNDAARPRDTGTDAPREDAGPLPSCGTESPLALSSCVDATRYEADLDFVAQERVPESTHWQAVQDLCASRLESLGFAVERQSYATGVNVVGVRLGTTEPDHRILVSAHYDHIAGCDGADDNASGVAGALEAARVLSMQSYARTLVVTCWDEEERGLIGSRAYAAAARTSGEVIDATFDFEMIGYRDTTPDSQRLPVGIDVVFREAAAEYEANMRRGDFVAVIGDPASAGAMASLETYADRIGLPFIPLLVPESFLGSPLAGDLRRSDHASFWDEGYPGIMITDTSEFRYDAYHCTSGPDVPANLDVAFASQIVTITVAAAAEQLGM